MLEISAERFSRALMNFTMMRHLLGQINTLPGGSDSLNEASIQGVLENLDGMERELDTLGAKFTIMAVRDLKAQIQDGEDRAFILSPRAYDIERRLQDELKSVTMFIVDASHAELYANSENFLDEASQKVFPSAIFDCREAGKCFALSRYTACVFHLMRATEAVAIILADKIGVPPKKSNGETFTLGQLSDKILEKIKELPSGIAKDEWHGVNVFLTSCNRAFRTKTAHPVETYTEEEAKEILSFTRGFIKASSSLI
ncbi:hypothetical protein [Novosphingobium album (ex Liu et al. 2023)]|nr:hypothetical protein [Novosphingobium album (ex Liu et al. 2023)]